jgi:lysophospholipase L1-like esterase
MRVLINICIVISMLIISVNGFSQGHHVRIAFMGNSITIGAGLTNPTVEAYPGQVSTMLSKLYGDTCVVGNFAVSGRTLLKKGDYPLWNEKQYDDSWSFAPDIVFILLGTNDTKPQNWGPYGNEYFDDYQSMIDSFRVRNPRVKVMCGFPPPCYEHVNLGNVWEINDSIILHGVIPIVDSIATLNDAAIVDFYHPLLDSGYLFPDKVHPNVQGSKVMAQLVVDKMVETDIIHTVETGYTYVTGVTSNRKIIASGEPAIISWTSINADSVFFEGKKADLSGSVTVTPASNKIYTVYAYGKKGIDSMKYEQNVYIPVLEKLGANPRTAKITQHDSLDIALIFYDQENKVINGQSFNVNWTIREGGGSLINKTGTSATFIGSEAGKTYVVASVGTISIEVRVTVEAKLGSKQLQNAQAIRLFPNPAGKTVNLDVSGISEGKLDIRVYDVKGALCHNETIETSSGKQCYTVNVEKLTPGLYLLEAEKNGIKLSDKFRKE